MDNANTATDSSLDASQADVSQYMAALGLRAKKVSRIIAAADSASKNQALQGIADALNQQRQAIISANAKDLANGQSNGLSDALLDRLTLDDARIDGIIESVQQIMSLADPVGAMDNLRQRPSGISVGKMRVPLGVIGIIYESRPNVTIDAAVLCLKAGNAAVLRGGSEAIHSNKALAACIEQGLQQAGLPADVVQLVATTDRAAVGQMITDSANIDIIIPRGGKGLIERISAQATVPVIKHLDGICHVYIDSAADLAKANAVAFNAKTRRYGICGAMESLLIHQDVVESVLPDLAQRFSEHGVELRGCARSLALVPGMNIASEADWQTEYLDAILSIRVVDDLSQAIEHINHYGSQHTDSIISENLSHANRFLREVDSASVMINASTQFADGFEYGLGAEIGISTNKLHVRGPVGLEGLTCEKYVVMGDGTIRP